MKKEINCNWKGNMAFEANVDEHKILLDTTESNGGSNTGPTPKPLLLVALAGCTGMDVISLLKKMRVEFESCNIRVIADTNEEHPKYYPVIEIIYELKGKNMDRDKVEKAVNLSLEKYCGVNFMLSKAAKISHKIMYVT